MNVIERFLTIRRAAKEIQTTPLNDFYRMEASTNMFGDHHDGVCAFDGLSFQFYKSGLTHEKARPYHGHVKTSYGESFPLSQRECRILSDALFSRADREGILNNEDRFIKPSEE